MGKIISIFIDESGDVGFIKDASKYYIKGVNKKILKK